MADEHLIKGFLSKASKMKYLENVNYEELKTNSRNVKKNAKWFQSVKFTFITFHNFFVILVSLLSVILFITIIKLYIFSCSHKYMINLD